ncbi:unnamed protein product [Peronospora destructor]|uniref:C2H2-type domain-containing protein n=1 Tax=Peronospora destructor TaxID=86335 RepID=A0AAV0VCE2_9STRA|nr:unnamed protein product [Peronospora destructor]
MSLKISSENALSIERKSTCKEDKSSSSNSRDLNTIQSSILCAECGEQFMFATKLVEHGGLRKKSELQAHSYVHTGVLPFECEECGERFLKRFWLTRHQRKHDANKKADAQVYVCDCGKICFDEDKLESHKQIEHSSEDRKDIVDGGGSPKEELPTSVCLVCDQTFSRKQYLRAHLRTYFESLDARKQYTCPMDGCDKAYTRSSNLMAHYNAVHDKQKSKRFACPREDCTARFGYKTVLKHHIESIHDNPKPPKRRERKSVGILERVLGVNQLGEQEPQVAIVVEKCLTEPL